MTPDEEQLLFDEHEADTVAKDRPAISFDAARAGGILGGTTQQIAAATGRQVIQRATEAGLDDEAIQAMRGRMLKWLEIVKAFEVDRFEIRNDEVMDDRQKAMLLMSMHTQLDRARVGIFGQDYG